MLSEAENVMDYVPLACWFMLVPLILVSVPGTAATASAVNNQFVVHRLYQIDLPSGTFGSRSSVFTLEAITPSHIGDAFVRKCALFKLHELLQYESNNYDVFLNKVLSQSLVSAVLIIYRDLKTGFNDVEVKSLQAIERKLLANETALPIYLVEENEEINRLYEEYLQTNLETKTPSLYDFIVKNVFFDSHQFVISGPQTTSINNAVITSLQAKLIGAGPEDQLPTYAIVAHYDSYSVVPGLSFGADSNASGLVVLLELMRIFSRLYASPKTKPKANLVFFVSGGGKINYFGTKKWLEDNLDSGHTATTPLFENMQFALCLDSLADSFGSEGLFMYVSKPPKSGSPAGAFLDKFTEVAGHYRGLNSSMIHKKINLAEDFLSWEHERFSMRRISAFTLSSILLPRAMKKQTLSDVYQETYIDTLETNTNIIGEALARHLFGEMNENLLKAEYAVSRAHIKSLFEHVANIPRAQQMLLTSSKGASYQLPPLLKTIQTVMRKYSNNHIKLLHSKIDSKNPEFVFYDPVTTKMEVYNMKPAVFDIIITISILLYLGIFYLTVKNFHYFTFGSRSGNYENNVTKVKSK